MLESMEFTCFSIRVRNIYLLLHAWIEQDGRLMCLLKVYLKKGSDRRLIAEDVALVVKEGDRIKLRNLELTDVVTLEEIDISLIDTLNSVIILKPKT